MLGNRSSRSINIAFLCFMLELNISLRKESIHKHNWIWQNIGIKLRGSSLHRCSTPVRSYFPVVECGRCHWCSILACTILYYPTRANVNTCPIPVRPWGYFCEPGLPLLVREKLWSDGSVSPLYFIDQISLIPYIRFWQSLVNNYQSNLTTKRATNTMQQGYQINHLTISHFYP